MNGIGLKKSDDILQKKAAEYCILYKLEWSTKLSSASLRTLADNKFKKIQLFPTTEDLLKLKKFCDNETLRLQKILRNSEVVSVVDWLELAQLTMPTILVFNKRPANEPSNLLLERFLSRGDYYIQILSSHFPHLNVK